MTTHITYTEKDTDLKTKLFMDNSQALAKNTYQI